MKKEHENKKNLSFNSILEEYDESLNIFIVLIIWFIGISANTKARRYLYGEFGVGDHWVIGLGGVRGNGGFQVIGVYVFKADADAVPLYARQKDNKDGRYVGGGGGGYYGNNLFFPTYY